jgi:hypothetical protein
VKLCPTSNKRPRSTQGAYFRSHARSANQRVQNSQGLLLTSLTIILFTRVALRTKAKGLLINTPHIFYYFQHVLCHVQKARCSILRRVQKVRCSIGMCSKFIILLIKCSKVFAAQQVSSSMVWLYPKPRERVS